MKTEQDYTAMQKQYYEDGTPVMAIQNHLFHNDNPEYWSILLKPLQSGDWSDKTVLDFGCGCGRNVMNVLKTFNVKEAHGCDISSNNVEYSKKFVLDQTGKTNFHFFATDGQSLQPGESNAYDLIFSTIVLQHIPVHNIRKKIMTDFYRCVKPGGMISFQMGFGSAGHRVASYYENATHAETTNGGYDVQITDPKNLVDDLVEIGFKDVNYVIGQPWTDQHSNWIYVTAVK